MIRAAFFDVDGTLVSYRLGAVTDRLREDLLELRRRGVRLFVATGRARQDLARTGMLRDLAFDAYITLNGRCCFHGEEIYLDRPMPREDLEGAAAVLRAHPHMAALMAGNGKSCINRLTPRAVEIFRFLHTRPYEVQPPEWMLEHKVYQIAPLVEPGEEEVFLRAMPHCTHTRWHPQGVDILPAGDGKAEGVRATLEHYGLRPEEIIAFGDGDNDRSMLAMAGVGVAMGNAEQKVKDEADWVTGSVEEDGVSAALRRFGLLD